MILSGLVGSLVHISITYSEAFYVSAAAACEHANVSSFFEGGGVYICYRVSAVRVLNVTAVYIHVRRTWRV